MTRRWIAWLLVGGPAAANGTIAERLLDAPFWFAVAAVLTATATLVTAWWSRRAGKSEASTAWERTVEILRAELEHERAETERERARADAAERRADRRRSAAK